jgi:hypothetical protein
VHALRLNAGGKQIGKTLGAGQVDQIDARDQAHGVTDRRGIHVVLHCLGCHGNVTDAQSVAKRACHAHVDNGTYAKVQNHGLCAHSGKHLADATLRNDGILAAKRAVREFDRAYCQGLRVLHLRDQRIDLASHRTDNTNTLIHRKSPFFR